MNDGKKFPTLDQRKTAHKAYLLEFAPNGQYAPVSIPRLKARPASFPFAKYSFSTFSPPFPRALWSQGPSTSR
jgi:hypothetical protein